MTEHRLFPEAEKRGTEAAALLKGEVDRSVAPTRRNPTLGIIFTAGLDKGLPWDQEPFKVALVDIPGFEELRGYPVVKDHARDVVYGSICGVPIIGLLGRIHLYEGEDETQTRRMVRLMVDMLIHLGAETVITTSLVGSCTQTVRVGQVSVPNGFLSSGNRMTGVGTEGFPTLENGLDADLVRYLLMDLVDEFGHMTVPVTHAFWNNPTIEGAAQKEAFRRLGADVIGCSGQPELESVARQREAGRKVSGLVLGFVTNGMVHSDKAVGDAVERYGDVWREFLCHLIRYIGQRN
ncbi:MAG TPA: hypothetical protein QF873_00985 [Patescibacteria group bacterium]|nr:hypothetical protein [Patescibacteria group bacterium]